MDGQHNAPAIGVAPKGLAILAVVGPSMVWAAEYIGSGEVIIATRTGAVLGTGVLWAVVMGVFLKFWIGMAAARYTVCTGEGMIDMFARAPGPRNWAVWVVMVVQVFCAVLATGTLATAAARFMHSLVAAVPMWAHGLAAVIFAASVAWSGTFDVLKMVMSAFVLIIVIGAIYIAAHVFPPVTELLAGLAPRLPEIPEWARAIDTVSDNPWEEVMPVLGWGAGGFASQVWYTYWVIGAGYGATAGRGYGRAADEGMLRTMSEETARKLKGWCRVLYADSTCAMVLGVFVTAAFLICGAGILGVAHEAPSDANMADTLARVFSSRWNVVGGFLFKLCGAVAMVSTLTGQLAGWPRLLADSCRLTIPGFGRRLAWKAQFRLFLAFFFCTTVAVVFVLGGHIIFLLKISSILEGLLLIALQAALVGVGLFVVMRRMLSAEAWRVLKPSPVFAVGLVVTFLFFGYICVTQIPGTLWRLIGGK